MEKLKHNSLDSPLGEELSDKIYQFTEGLLQYIDDSGLMDRVWFNSTDIDEKEEIRSTTDNLNVVVWRPDERGYAKTGASIYGRTEVLKPETRDELLYALEKLSEDSRYQNLGHLRDRAESMKPGAYVTLESHIPAECGEKLTISNWITLCKAGPLKETESWEKISEAARNMAQYGISKGNVNMRINYYTPKEFEQEREGEKTLKWQIEYIKTFDEVKEESITLEAEMDGPIVSEKKLIVSGYPHSIGAENMLSRLFLFSRII